VRTELWRVGLAGLLVCLLAEIALSLEWVVAPAVKGEMPQERPELVYVEDAGAFLLAFEDWPEQLQLSRGDAHPSGYIRWRRPVFVDSCGIWARADLAVAWPDIFILWGYYWNGYSDVYLSRSSDGGNEFEEPVLVTTFAVGHDIALDLANSEIVVVYGHADGLVLRRSQDWGSSFLEPQTVDSLADFPQSMELAISADGIYHVAYVDSFVPPFYYWRVNYRRSQDQGWNWTQVRIDEDPERSEDVVLGLDDDGNPMIAWLDAPLNFLFRRSLDQGTTFGSIVPVDTSNVDKVTTSLAVDCDGNPHLAWWADLGFGRIWYTYSENGGESFLPSMQVDPATPTIQRWPSMAIGTLGLPAVVWVDYRDDEWGDLWYGAAVPSGVEEETEELAPFSRSLGLLPNYPNPFLSSTSIMYELPQPEHVSLRVYDVLGRLVRVLVDGHREAGRHRVLWDGLDHGGARVSSGVYFARLESNSEAVVRSMVLLR